MKIRETVQIMGTACAKALWQREHSPAGERKEGSEGEQAVS